MCRSRDLQSDQEPGSGRIRQLLWDAKIWYLVYSHPSYWQVTIYQARLCFKGNAHSTWLMYPLKAVIYTHLMKSGVWSRGSACSDGMHEGCGREGVQCILEGCGEGCGQEGVQSMRMHFTGPLNCGGASLSGSIVCSSPGV